MKSFVFLLLALLAPIVQTQNLGCGIATIPDELVEYGCGCNYYLAGRADSPAIIFQAELDLSHPRMYINNTLTTLTPIHIETAPTIPEDGDQFEQRFTDNERIIFFENVVSAICNPEQEGCEVMRFDSLMRIKSGHCQPEETEIQGDCGC